MTFKELSKKAAEWWEEQDTTLVERMKELGVSDAEKIEDEQDRVGLGAGTIIGLYLAEHQGD